MVIGGGPINQSLFSKTRITVAVLDAPLEVKGAQY